MTNHARMFFLIVALGLGASALTAQTGRLGRGRVMNSVDSSAVPSVLVAGGIESVRSNDRGEFVIRLPGGTTILTVSRLGFVTQQFEVPPGGPFTIWLVPSALRVAPIRAEAGSVARERFEESVQASTISLNHEEITAVPALLEPDLVRVVQLLPGTVAKNDFTTGFNVRGGESDQNLILLDGGVVFNPFHLGGLFSTFETAAVEAVDFVSGGFSAGYSGRLSSVLDVGLRDGRGDTHVGGLVSAVAAKVMIDGPIGNTGAHYLVSGRRTYADQLVRRFSDEDLPYYFGDALARVDVRTFGGYLAVTAYGGVDDLDWPWIDAAADRDPVNLRFRWGNRMAAVNFERPAGRGTLLVHASGSGFGARFGLEPDVIRVENDVSLLSGRIAYVFPWSAHEIRLGGSAERYNMRYDIRSPTLETTSFTARYAPVVWSAFVDDQWKPADWFFARPGIRLEHIPAARTTVVSPRIALKLFLDRETAITASAGRYHQAVHSLRDPDIPYTLFDFWIGTDNQTPVASSDHLVAGIERWVSDDVSLSAEGYRKTFSDLVIRNRSQDPRQHGDEFIPTEGDAWGFDVLLRKHRGSISGWIGYGFAKATRRAEGVAFPPAHDRRHTLNVVGFGPGPLGSEMGVRWGFGSPLPYTGLDGAWRHRTYNSSTHAFDDFEEEPLGSIRQNGERYPSYGRLDVSFRWTKYALGGVLRPYLQVINAYNRTNVFVYLYDYEDSPATRTGISQFPIFPSFGLEFEF